MQIPETIHPEIRKGLEAIETPEVQHLIKQLSGYGLAVALPHAHGENGNFLPLPRDTVVFETGQQVSFVPKDDPSLKTASRSCGGGTRAYKPSPTARSAISTSTPDNSRTVEGPSPSVDERTMPLAAWSFFINLST